MKRLFLFAIRLYQKTISPDHGLIRYLYPFGRVCRFEPTCSEYTHQAIQKFGILYGITLGLKRISKCHPGNSGGFDPIPTSYD